MIRADITVANEGELSTVHVAELDEGSNAWVDNPGAYYTLEKQSGAPPVPGSVVAPIAGSPIAGFPNARWVKNAGIPASVGPSGDPNSIAFFSPTGATLIDNPKLTAAPLDPFARPQIRDDRSAAGVGSVFRQGAWQADGDPDNQSGEGAVYYGPNALGLGPDATQGGYARIKPLRIGLAEIVPGINGGFLFYYFRVDGGEGGSGTNGLNFTDDANVQQFHIDRLTGTVIMGAGNAQFFGNAPGALHGSNAGLQYSSTVANRAAERVNQYGANTGIPGHVGFKSRGLTIGSLASVLVGDFLWRATAIGVTGNNTNVPNAGFAHFVVPVGGVAATSVAVDFEFQLTNKAGVRDTRMRITSEGEWQQQLPGQRIQIKEGANAMQGVATLGAGATIVVANTLVTATSRVMVTVQPGPAPLGAVYVAAIVAGANFTITSNNVGDVGVNVAWQIWEPAP